MINDIESEKISVVITKDLSRLGRDYLQTGYYLKNYFPLHEVRFIAINDNVDTLLKENDLTPFRNIMNEWYARDISKKIRSAYKTKALNGKFTGAYPPYGYDKDPIDKNHLIINEIQAVTVKRIFRLYMDDINPFRIARILKKEKLLTLRAEQCQNTGKYKSEHLIKYPYDWSNRTITEMLGKEVYIGNIICNKWQTKNYKSKKLEKNDKDNWIISKNMHEAIIDNDTFYKVQNKLNQNIKIPKTGHLNIFKGKVRCSDCGYTLSLFVKKDRKSYGSFACSNYRRFGKERCSMHYITYEELYDAILSRINDLIEKAKRKRIVYISKIKADEESSIMARVVSRIMCK